MLAGILYQGRGIFISSPMPVRTMVGFGRENHPRNGSWTCPSRGTGHRAPTWVLSAGKGESFLRLDGVEVDFLGAE